MYFLSEQKKIRSDRCLEIAKRLKMYYGLDLDTSRLMKRSCVTRGSIAHEMVRQGMPYTVQEIFEKFSKTPYITGEYLTYNCVDKNKILVNHIKEEAI